MRSPAARLIVGVAACIAFGIASLLVIQSERQLTSRRNAVRTFDVLSREAVASLASLRSAEAAYLVAGQGLGHWMSRVDALLESATSRLEELRPLASSDDTRTALASAATAVESVRNIDKRAREYLHTDQPVMASDVIFADAAEAATSAGRQIEAARLLEYTRWDADEAAVRRRQLYTGAAAVGIGVLALGLFAFAPAGGTQKRQQELPAATAPVESRLPPAAVVEPEPPAEPVPAPRTAPVLAPPQEPPELPSEIVPILKATVEVCTDLNRARETDDLSRLLARAAQVMDASGLVVWLGVPGGKSLRPVLAHGYSQQALARMPHVPRSGDNAAAAAYRTEQLQIVLTKPGVASGALAAPMISPDGCIGALTAEIRNGSETSDGVQALAAIFAAQLAGVLVDSVMQPEEALPESRIASA